MAVAFKELAGSPSETYSPDGLRAERRILVAWEDRYAMVAELLGDGYEFGGVNRAHYPDRQSVVAIETRLEPWPEAPDDQGAFSDIQSELNSYSGKYALLVVEYELLVTELVGLDLPEPEQGTFMSYRMYFGGEYEDLSGDSLSWASGILDPITGERVAVPPDAVPTFRVPITEHHVTWHRVVNPPWAAIRQTAGCVNAAAFLGAPAETVLFDGAKAKKEFIGIDSLQYPQFGWRIEYVFREKVVKIMQKEADPLSYGWNHRYRSLPAENPGWDRLVDAAGNARYRTADFNPLFRFAAIA